MRAGLVAELARLRVPRPSVIPSNDRPQMPIFKASKTHNMKLLRRLDKAHKLAIEARREELLELERRLVSELHRRRVSETRATSAVAQELAGPVRARWRKNCLSRGSAAR
jgi:hypothetical protein